MTESKPRILIVEDDENIRKTMKNILQQEGYETDTAKSGKEGEQKAMSSFYNLALLDIKLPGHGGHSASSKIA